MKATRGTNKTLSCFTREFPRALAAGLAVAPFHFYAQDNPTSGVAQADRFIGVLRSVGYTGQRPGELPPILDLEWQDGGGCWPGPPSTVIADAKAFLDRVEAAFGRKPIIYTNRYYIRDCLGDTAEFAGYPLQISNYSNVSQPALPPGSPSWLMWQYACEEPVPGMFTNEHCNSVFNGTQAELDALANRGERTVFGEINGDGWDEIITVADNGDVVAYENLGGGWGRDPVYQGQWSRRVAQGGFRPANTRFADIDGDGWDEIVTVADNGDVVAYRNLGGGFGSGPVYDGGSSRLVAQGGFRPANTRFADIDGDGWDEIVTVADNGDVVAYRNLGGGFGSGPVYDGGSSRLVARGGFRPGNTRFADIDGYGADEIVTVADNGDVVAYQNLGGGFGSGPVYAGSRSRRVAQGGFRFRITRFADIDSDGFDEIVTVADNGNVVAYRNLGGGFGTGPVYDGGWSKLVARGGFRP